MIVFDKPADYIMVRADNNSDWDHCTFAMISLPAIRALNLRRCLAIARRASRCERFSSIHFDVEGVHFFSSLHFPVADLYLEEVLPHGKDWVYVEVEDKEMNSFERPENSLVFCEMVCTRHDLYFAADGKHTGERFWTKPIPLNVMRGL